MATDPLQPVPPIQPSDPVSEVAELTDRCARPGCRKEFMRVVERGRPREYCSETCKKLADKQYKQAVAAVVHYEKLVRQAKADVTAFGRAGEGDAKSYEGSDAVRGNAQRVWERAKPISVYVPDGDPLLKATLAELVAAVEPIIED